MGASNGFVRSLVVVVVALAVIAIAVPAALAEQAPPEKGEKAEAGSAAKEGVAAKAAPKAPKRKAGDHGKFVSDLKALLTEAKAAIKAKDTAKASAKIDAALKMLERPKKDEGSATKHEHPKGAEHPAAKKAAPKPAAKKAAPKPAATEKEEPKEREPATKQDK